MPTHFSSLELPSQVQWVCSQPEMLRHPKKDITKLYKYVLIKKLLFLKKLTNFLTFFFPQQ